MKDGESTVLKRGDHSTHGICTTTTRSGNQGHTHTLLHSEEMAKATHAQADFRCAGLLKLALARLRLARFGSAGAIN